MESDRLINQFVLHKSYGKGIIRSADGEYLGVDFADKGKTSRFVYPSCFYRFLTLEDGELQKEIDAVVEVWKQENGVNQKEKLRHQYEKTMQGIETRRQAAEEKKLKMAQRAIEHRSAYSSMRQEKKNGIRA